MYEVMNLNEEEKSIDTNKPIENHSTAAWANIEQVKPESNVPIPSDLDAYNAKDYVDSNEK